MKTWEARLANKQHVVTATIQVVCDGYMSALVESNKVCKEFYPELYVLEVRIQ